MVARKGRGKEQQIRRTEKLKTTVCLKGESMRLARESE